MGRRPSRKQAFPYRHARRGTKCTVGRLTARLACGCGWGATSSRAPRGRTGRVGAARVGGGWRRERHCLRRQRPLPSTHALRWGAGRSPFGDLSTCFQIRNRPAAGCPAGPRGGERNGPGRSPEPGCLLGSPRQCGSISQTRPRRPGLRSGRPAASGKARSAETETRPRLPLPRGERTRRPRPPARFAPRRRQVRGWQRPGRAQGKFPGPDAWLTVSVCSAGAEAFRPAQPSH